MLIRLHRPLLFVIIIIALCIFLTSHRWSAIPPVSLSAGTSKGAIEGIESAGNSTLGFQKILALSRAPTWRSRGLLKAAAYTGLDIGIPKQARWTSEMVDAFQYNGAIGVPHPKRGAALAWLAHLDLVRFVVQSDFDTALILEDDVDWDVNIKEQTVRIARAVREFTHVSSSEPAPYGHAWDILWLGLCSEFVDTGRPHVSFEDPTVIPKAKHHGWTHDHVIQIPEGERFVHWGLGPVCTFGYAVSRKGAKKILEHAGRGQNVAYDLQLQEGCRDRVLDCITVNPEIMHEYYPPARLGYRSEVDIGNDDGGAAVDEKRYEQVMGSTKNIVTSTRCRVMFGKTCLYSGEDNSIKD